MVANSLRAASIAACLVVVASFAMFASDESSGASEGQQAKVSETQAPNPGAAGERAREARHSTVRELIDDANDVLVSPFAGAGGDSSEWVQRGVPMLIALMLYGMGLGFLARYAQVHG